MKRLRASSRRLRNDLQGVIPLRCKGCNTVIGRAYLQPDDMLLVEHDSPTFPWQYRDREIGPAAPLFAAEDIDPTKAAVVRTDVSVVPPNSNLLLVLICARCAAKTAPLDLAEVRRHCITSQPLRVKTHRYR